MKKKPIDELKNRLTEITHLGSTIAVLNWDQQVFMPAKGAEMRAKTIAHLSGLYHMTLIAIDSDGLLTNLKSDLDLERKQFSPKDRVIISETWRSFEREKKLPEAFVKELSQTVAEAHTVWVEAKNSNNFKLFQPWLEKIVALKRKEAKYVGYEESPYDALIDLYEPGMTADRAAVILNDLKDFLIPFIEKIKKSKVKLNPKKIQGKFPIQKQKELNELIAKQIGFDLTAGRIDESAHPFTINFNALDVRFTTKYSEENIMQALGATIHEAGHGMYEQGLPSEYFGTPLSESISLGIHESQSRFWENMVGKSKEFWHYFYPKLKKEFPQPFSKISADEFYLNINTVQPSLIRIESDEVTYNIHIIIRFEIEKDLIEGSIEVADVPKIWKTKMKEYLGITVPNDRQGALQDVHWSTGAFGYFPTYTFGNLYSGQFTAQMMKDIPDMKKQIAKGKFDEILNWLRKNIHQHGKMYTAGSLVRAVTGEPLDSKYFIEYLKEKFFAIYKL